ncbi:MAG: ComF family protein [Candidatus Angelobacter sp.]
MGMRYFTSQRLGRSGRLPIPVPGQSVTPRALRTCERGRYTWGNRPAWSPAVPAGRGRLVFSSSGIPIRAPESAAKQNERTASLVTSATRITKSSIAKSWIAESLFATLFPSDCRLCFSPLTNISRLPVCEACLEQLHPVDGIVCAICGEKIQTTLAQTNRAALCGLCQKKTPPFEQAAAYGSYTGNLRELIHLLKYEQIRPAANVLGRLLAEAIAGLEANFADEQIIVIPVPLYKGKRRQRGFNQAELIAKAALRLRRPRRFELMTGLLKRVRPTESQIGLTRHQRRENIRGAFGAAKGEEIAGREILLVDDVFTTGTTASECARVLLRSGASKVWVATVARTQKVEAQKMETSAVEGPDTLAVAV